jgi:hypothetical protein
LPQLERRIDTSSIARLLIPLAPAALALIAQHLASGPYFTGDPASIGPTALLAVALVLSGTIVVEDRLVSFNSISGFLRFGFGIVPLVVASVLYVGYQLVPSQPAGWSGWAPAIILYALSVAGTILTVVEDFGLRH